MANWERYLLSLNLLRAMLKKGVITDAEFSRCEEFFADKNCIKKGSIYRENDLINPSFRAIYMTTKIKEVSHGNDN